MISFIMPAKDASLYIKDAIGALVQAAYRDWELIVIEDHSVDDTLAILREIEKTDSRITVFVNVGTGKVQGLNYGYSLSKGELIKCIDADDVLDSSFFDYIPFRVRNVREGNYNYLSQHWLPADKTEKLNHDQYICKMNDCDAMCNDYYITSEKLSNLGYYSVNKVFLNGSFDYCLRYLASIPRCAWTFTRDIAEKIFPMPNDLPFEDIWFSLIIKKYADKIDYVNKPLYHYRQHSNQTYGGILNFNFDIVAFRAQRILKFIEVVKNEPTRRLVSDINTDSLFDEILAFNRLLAKKPLAVSEIIKSPISISLRIKLLIYRKLSVVAPLFVKAKWLWDKMSKKRTENFN